MRKPTSIICAVLAIVIARRVQAGSPSTKPNITLDSATLSGTWKGEAEGVGATVEFHCSDTCGNDITWHLLNAKALISADMKLVNEPNAGTVGLRFDFRKSQTGEKGSEIIGRLERGTDGKLYLTVLPAAESIDPDYVKVRQIELQSANIR